MKIYVLIQKYPGIPKDWELGTVVGGNPYNFIPSKFRPFNYKLSDLQIPKKAVQCKEFWKELPEFTILSFISTGGSILEKVTTSDGTSSVFTSKNGVIESEESLLKNNAVEIRSVLRNTDNVVFTLGDTLKRHKDRVCKEPNSTIRVIGELNIKSNGDVNFSERKGLLKFQLSAFSKAKLPIFKSDDGVDIFEGDRIWGVYTNTFTPFYTEATKTKVSWVNGVFSNEEAAKNYVLLNKKTISLKDLEPFMRQSVDGADNSSATLCVISLEDLDKLVQK